VGSSVDWSGGLLDAEASLELDDEEEDEDAPPASRLYGRRSDDDDDDDDDDLDGDAPAAEFWPNPEEFKGMLLDESKMRIDLVGALSNNIKRSFPFPYRGWVGGWVGLLVHFLRHRFWEYGGRKF
jgi:hypothetical protein